MVRDYWWKIVGVLLVVYSIIAGLVIPLGPGISKVTPISTHLGEKLELEVSAYNTSYESSRMDDLRAWLKLDDRHSVRASHIASISRNRLDLTFDVPDHMPAPGSTSRFFTLVIDDKGEGTAILPAAVSLRTNLKGEDSASSQGGEWLVDDITELTIHRGITFPYRNILQETIRNTFFHVAFWMAMFVILSAAAWYSISYLRSKNPVHDYWAVSLTEVGLVYGIVGLITGMIWGKYTWGSAWPDDAKLNMTAICLMIYAAYFLLRNGIREFSQRARIAGVYNVFAYVSMFPLLFVIPRMVDSLHPGNGGNPAMGGEDLDSTMRMVFYPAIVGWILIGLWIAELHSRILKLKMK